MIGNDLVFLDTYHHGDAYRLKRKFRKVCSEKELSILPEKNQKTFDIVWSIKEACYKAFQREYNFSMKLNPLEFQIQSIVFSHGFCETLIRWKGNELKVLSLVNREFVYSFTSHSIHHYFNFSVCMPKQLKSKLKISKSLPIHTKIYQLPYILISNQVKPLSITHENAKIAFAW